MNASNGLHDAPDSVVVYLARHGRTALNAAGRLRGRLDPPLDDVGREEARALATVFAGVPLTLVVSSPLRRALETATAMADSSGTEIEIDDRFADRDYGDFAGRTRAEIEAEFGGLEHAPGVESTGALARRVRQAFDAISAGVVGGRAVVVAHEVINESLLRDLLPGTPRELIPQRTGCWNRIVSTDGGTTWSVQIVDAVPGDGRMP